LPTYEFKLPWTFAALCVALQLPITANQARWAAMSATAPTVPLSAVKVTAMGRALS